MGDQPSTTPAYPSGIPEPIFRVLMDLLAVLDEQREHLTARRERDAATLDTLSSLADCIGQHVDIMEAGANDEPVVVVDRGDNGEVPRGWADLSNSDAVEQVLARAGAPLSRQQVVNALAGAGLDLTPTQVSSALNYLRAKDVANSDDEHRWSLVRQPANA